MPITGANDENSLQPPLDENGVYLDQKGVSFGKPVAARKTERISTRNLVFCILTVVILFVIPSVITLIRSTIEYVALKRIVKVGLQEFENRI